MQLNPGERSILAYFTQQEQAQQAAQTLRSMGYQDLQITLLSPYPRRPMHKSSPSYLSHLVLGSRGGGEYNPGHGPLIAAEPAVSGMSSPSLAAAEPSYLLTLVCNTEDGAAALEVLKQYGASI